jgi:hypothetical protein
VCVTRSMATLLPSILPGSPMFRCGT